MAPRDLSAEILYEKCRRALKFKWSFEGFHFKAESVRDCFYMQSDINFLTPRC